MQQDSTNQTCPTCSGAADSPYRNSPIGITEGCVDAFHTGHVYGADLAWHERPEGKEIRRRNAEWKRRITAFSQKGA